MAAARVWKKEWGLLWGHLQSFHLSPAQSRLKLTWPLSLLLNFSQTPLLTPSFHFLPTFSHFTELPPVAPFCSPQLVIRWQTLPAFLLSCRQLCCNCVASSTVGCSLYLCVLFLLLERGLHVNGALGWLGLSSGPPQLPGVWVWSGLGAQAALLLLSDLWGKENSSLHWPCLFNE